jgi:hypothetical protein
MNFSKGLKAILLPVLFVLSSAAVSHSQEFISILKTDWIIMKNLLNLQDKQIKTLETVFKQQLLEIENLNQLSNLLQIQLDASIEALERSRQLSESLTESIQSYEKLLISTNKKAELQKVLLIVIPIALIVLAVAGFGFGVYVGFKYL